MTEQRREIGFWTATSLVIGSMIGSGVFLLPASLALFGGIALIGWIVSAAGGVLLALLFAHLARKNPAAGGVYAYTRIAFGDFPGFIVAWGYWISVWSANAALSIAFVGYFHETLRILAPGITPEKLPTAAALMLAVGSLWFLTLVNSFGVRAAGRVQVVTTVLKLLPLVIVGIGGLIMFNASRFAIPDAAVVPFGPTLSNVVALTLFAFVGLEVATIPAGAVVDPDRTIPRATMIGTVATAAIYIASTAGAMSLVAPDILSKSTAPFADAARAMGGGQWLPAIVALGAAISAFGSLNGWILTVGQLPMAVANDGTFPKFFAKLNSRQTPVLGMVVSGVLATGLIAINYSSSDPNAGLVKLFSNIVNLSVLATLIAYVFCAFAVLLGRGKVREKVQPGMALIAVAALVFSAYAIYGVGSGALSFGFWLIVAGLPVFFWARSERRAR